MVREGDLDYKKFMKEIGKLIDARAKTQEVVLKAYMDSAIKTSEERLKKELASKEDIKDMVRKSDIKDMVRKSDIKDMVRKSDINDMVRKKDIENMATKDDIKDMATKQDLADLKAELKEDIRRLEVKVDETKDLRRIVDELRMRVEHAEMELEGVKRGIKSGVY
jgi:hypothetical protein